MKFMALKDFADFVFSLGKKRGFEECQIHFAREHEFEIHVSKGKVETFKDADYFSVSFKGLREGKCGRARVEALDREVAKLLVEEALSNLQVIDSSDMELLHDGSGDYVDVDYYKGNYERLGSSQKVEMAKELERTALATDKRIVMAPRNVFGHVTSEEVIMNTLGLEKAFTNDGGYAYTMVLASDGKTPKSGFKLKVSKTPEELDVQDIARKAAREALALLGATSVESGRYNVIIRRDVVAEMLGRFSSIFSAEDVQKKMSPIKDKLGQMIAASVLNLFDDPFIPESFTSRPFDSEGVPTSRKAVIEKGKLATYLYDLKSAHKDGVKSTGNAVGSTIAPINISLKGEEELPFQELLKRVKKGILVIGVDGLHSGADPISGNFSLGARGYLVKDGEIVQPVEQITISGNFVDMLTAVKAVGSDHELNLSMYARALALVPSVLVESLDIAGK